MKQIVKYILICFTILGSVQIQAQELNKEAFSLINLDTKGLEEVKQFYNEGKYYEAASALLSYYKNRKGIVCYMMSWETRRHLNRPP